MLQFREINPLTTDFRDIREKWRKTALLSMKPPCESRRILDFRDPFFPETKKARRRVPTGGFQNL
jgi:hypothetical protein